MILWTISEISKGNEEALLDMIQTFQPLLRKYAYLLNYNDAYEDLQLDFIIFLRQFKVNSVKTYDEGAIIEYIRVSVVNMYKARVKKLIRNKNEIPISQMDERQQSLIYSKCSENNNDKSFLIEYDLRKILCREEYEIIYLSFVMQFSDTEIARFKNKTRQAIFQRKKKALEKVRKTLS